MSKRSYKVTRTLILGPVRTINRNKVLKSGEKQKIGEETLNDIVGFEITRNDGKKFALTKDQACYFVSEKGGVIDNAMLGERKAGGKVTYYLRGTNGLSLKDPKLTLRIDDGDANSTGKLKPQFAAFKGVTSMRDRVSSKPKSDPSQTAKRAMEALAEKGVKINLDF